MPVREPLSRCGALVMDSMPPATTTLAEPALMASWASITAFMPEPHTLLMVVQPAAGGMPAPSAAWRAGAWPRPAGTHGHLVHLVGGEPGVLERAADRGASQDRRGHPGELAEEGTDGGALRTDDHDIRHADSVGFVTALAACRDYRTCCRRRRICIMGQRCAAVPRGWMARRGTNHVQA